jgi:hypothetical protein
VEGAHVGTSCENEAKHGIHVVEHVTRRNADDAKSFTSKHRVTSSIPPRLVSEAVTLPINFDDHSVAQTGGIGRNSIRRELPSELQTSGPISKHLPQQNFRQAHLTPQRTRTLDLLDRRTKDLGVEAAWAPSTTQLR